MNEPPTKTERYHKYWIGVIAMLFLGMVFLVAGLGKLLLQSTSVDVPPPLFLNALPIGIGQLLWGVLPYFEIVVGALLVFGIVIKLAVISAAFFTVLFMISNIAAIIQGEFCYTCFGVYGRLTAEAALVLDLIMACLIVTIFVCYRGRFLNFTPLILTTGHKAVCVPSLGTPEA